MRRLCVLVATALGLALVSLQAQPVAKVQPEALHSTHDVVRYAARGSAALPVGREKYARFLSVHNKIEPGERLNWLRVMSWFLNSLSKKRAIALPVFYPGSDNTLILVMLDDYGIDPAAWDALAKNGSGPKDARLPEPYFNEIVEFHEDAEEEVEVTEKREVVRRGNYVDPRTNTVVYGDYRVDEPVKVKKKVRRQNPTAKHKVAEHVLAPDGGQAFALLEKLTCTAYPILMADWFLYYASMAPAYYDLLGVGKSEKELDDFAFADSAIADKARVTMQGVVVFSGVSERNRALERKPTFGRSIGGYLWKSIDSKKSVGDRQYINTLVDLKGDASEYIFSLRNGLQGYFLTNAAGERIDVGETEVVRDRESKYPDPAIWCSRNCMVCHAQGLRPIEDEVRTLTEFRPFKEAFLKLVEVDPKRAEQIRDVYFSDDLSEVVIHDNLIYRTAVLAATSYQNIPHFTPETVAAMFEQMTWEYQYKPLTLDEMGALVGWPTHDLHAFLTAYANGVPDPITGLLLKPVVDSTITGQLKAKPRRTRRDQFEVTNSQLQKIVLGKKPPP